MLVTSVSTTACPLLFGAPEGDAAADVRRVERHTKGLDALVRVIHHLTGSGRAGVKNDEAGTFSSWVIALVALMALISHR